MYIKRVKINNFRTLDDFEVTMDRKLQIIVGANNIWKTNFLRALNLFFNSETDSWRSYDRSVDMPFFKREATWSPVQTMIEVDLIIDTELVTQYKLNDFIFRNSESENVLRTKCIYALDGEQWICVDKTGEFPNKKDFSKFEITWGHPIFGLFRRINFIYIPAQINIEDKINMIIRDEVLPIMADAYWISGDEKKQINEIIKQIEKLDDSVKVLFKAKNTELTKEINEVLKWFPEIVWGKGIENFSLELWLWDDSLTEILRKRIVFNVHDWSGDEIQLKWSGIQKLLLITLLRYVWRKNDEKKRYYKPLIIWWIDEPESFMQPKLQKAIRDMFVDISENFQIITTTHAPKFVDISDLSNIKLFYLSTEKIIKSKVEWHRKTGVFYKKFTKWKDSQEAWFLSEIKQHFWIEKNDGWIVTDKNILFEWFDDMLYFNANYQFFFWQPHWYSEVFCNSSTNMPSFAEFLYQQIASKSLQASAIKCLLDDDVAWREAFDHINRFKWTMKEKKFIKITLVKSVYLNETDNWNINYPKMIEDLLIPEVYFDSIIEQIKNDLLPKKSKNELELVSYNFLKFYADRLKMKKYGMGEFLNSHFNDILEWYDYFTLLGVKSSIAAKYKEKLEGLTEELVMEYHKKYQFIKDYYKLILSD